MKPGAQAGGLSTVLSLANQIMSGRPGGIASYNFGASVLDARPYSLSGQATDKPDYLQQRYTLTAGGRLKVPKLFDAGPRTFFFASYLGDRSANVYSQYSTVPTLAERAGDLSLLAAPLTDPATGQPFPGNQIPSDRISPAARSLLKFIPEPNQPDDRQNFHYLTTSGTTMDDVNIRIVRTFTVGSRRQPGSPGAGRPAAGAGRGVPGAGALAALVRPSGGRTLNLNAGIRYQRADRGQRNPFPTITAATRESGWDIPVSFGFPTWGLIHNVRFGFSRSSSQTSNSFAFIRDVAGEAGIAGVATEPFDWGVPNLSFSSMSGLRDVTPSLRRSQTVTFADSLAKTRGRHTFRFGGDFSDVRIDSRSDASAGGSFVFTGLYTGGASRASGADFADFLLGLPQQASVQYGPGLARFRSRAWNLYVQDDWRVTSSFTVNAGLRYEYQSPYSVAQRMAGQPPFAVTDTRIGSPLAPLTLTNAFGTPAATTTNNFGVDRDYRLGYAQIWNADVQRTVARTLVLGVSYTGTKGSQLDLQRAPNRGPSGLRIPDVQPFIWESPGARSIMHAFSVRVNRRLAQGISGSAAYTISRSRDNASTIGGGAATVAQNEQDLAAEWGLSSFDQRHRLSANATLELPFGENRRWLRGGGPLAEILGGWIWSVNLLATSGTPWTARVLGDVGDVARGTNGTLRADYLGGPITMTNPTTTQFFNTAAFSVPAPGTFGSAARNSIRGPAGTTLNMNLMKTVTLAGLRGFSVRVQATNVLNTPLWAAIDTVVNSPTFGRVTAVRPMRSVQAIARVMF